MYVCIYVCVHVCIYVFVYVYIKKISGEENPKKKKRKNKLGSHYIGILRKRKEKKKDRW